MSAIAEAAPDSFFASGRYSKRKRTQVNYCPSELDVSDAEEPDGYEIPQAKKTKAQQSSRPLPKRKIFPFLQLPAEIRNIIYGYTLTDSSGINLVAVFKHKRRTVERVDAETQTKISANRYWMSGRMNNTVRKENPEPTPITPALLSVNKQIYQEARDIFYGNEFIFADTFALYAFLINLGPQGAKYLKTLRLLTWGYGRAMKAYNHSCFALLVWAPNVTAFHIDAERLGWSRGAKSYSEQIYRDGFPFLEAIGRARGKADAAVDVLKINADVFGARHRDGDKQEIKGGEAGYKHFKEHLSNLLCKQQERVMKTAQPETKGRKNKKRRVSNDSDDEE